MRTHLFLLTLLLAACAAPADQLSGDERARLAITFPQPCSRGAVCTAELRIDGIDDLSAFQADIRYDPEALRVDEVSEGEFLTSDGSETFFIAPDLDEPGLIAHPAAARIGGGGLPGTGIDGAGTLVRIVFTPLDRGRTTLALERVKLVDPQGAPIDVATGEASIRIG